MLPIMPTLAILATFLAVLLSIFLLVVSSQMRLANTLLALFLLATALDISGWFMGEWWMSHRSLNQYRVAIAFVQMPLFSGYIWFNCFQRQVLHPLDALHFVPALAVLIATATDLSGPFMRVLFEAQYAVYIALAIYALWRVRIEMKARFKGSSANWNWLAVMVASSLVAHSLFVVRTVFASAFPQTTLAGLQAAATCLVLGITLLVAFQALLNPKLFRAQDRLLASAATTMVDQTAVEQDQRLLVFMEEHKPYLDPDISLSGLARRSGVPAKEISALINQRHGLHFFDFVNRYRIEHAKLLLIETDDTVTNIIFASGFNAKSSFNSAFRKQTGMTPSAFRQENRKK